MRLFAAESLRAMLLESSLAVTAERGVRVVSDYLPPKVSRSDEYDRIFQVPVTFGSDRNGLHLSGTAMKLAASPYAVKRLKW